MMAVKISVVIPTYNRPHLLKRCLTSLQNQNFNTDDFEIIAVADSTNGISFPEIDTNNLPAIYFYFLPEKKGAAAARNSGWHKAKGELIVFTDDDCIADTYFLEAYWNAYKQSALGSIAFTGKVIVPLNNKPTDYEKNTSQLGTAEFVTANCACTKSALISGGGFDENFKMAWREDSDLHFKLIKAGIPVIKVNEAIIFHPVRKHSFGISLKEQKKSMFNALLFKKYPDLYRQRISSRPAWNYYAMIICFIICCLLLLTGNAISGSIFLGTWLMQVVGFTLKRLKGTSHSLQHISEMFITSLLIPFLSVFWTLRGSIYYKTWFL